jgi:hypothetical protein
MRRCTARAPAYALIWLCGCAVRLSAQAPETRPTPSPSPTPAAKPTPAAAAAVPAGALPDLEITATVHFRQLRFDVVGEPRVEFTGTPERHTVWNAERIHLPRPVQPGVTYRDGGVRLTISSTFADLARLYNGPPANPPAGAAEAAAVGAGRPAETPRVAPSSDDTDKRHPARRPPRRRTRDRRTQ